MEKKFNQVYITICKISGKSYIGSHVSDKEFDSYLGSGILLTNAIKKYGIENFIRINLKNYDNVLDARKNESTYIEMFDTVKPNGYNLDKNGGHGWNGAEISIETREKIRQTLILNESSFWKKPRTIEEREATSKLHKGKKLTEEHVECIRKSHKGIPLTEEHKQKISLASKGKPLSDKHKESLKGKNKGKKSPFKGIPRSNEIKEKISLRKKGVKFSEEHKQKLKESHKGQIPWNKGKRKIKDDE